MAHIKKVVGKSGRVRWRLRLTLGREPKTGKRVVYTGTFDRKSEAEEKARQLGGHRGALREPFRKPFGDYLRSWLEDTAKLRVKARTFFEYKGTLERYVLSPKHPGAPRIRDIRMHQLSTEAIQSLYSWMMGRNLSPRTVQSLHQVLRSALNDAVESGAITRNPTKGTKRPPVVRGEVEVMDQGQARQFLKEAEQDELYALWAVLISTGLRPGEALGLRWADLDENRLQVQRTLTRHGVKGWRLTNPKTARARRAVVLPPVALDALRDHRVRQLAVRVAAPSWTDHDFIFTKASGEPLDQSYIYRKNFTQILLRAGLGRWEGEGASRTFDRTFTMYALRHTFATLALASGVNVKVVSSTLGHASVVLTLDTYAHVLDYQQEEVADRMQGVLGGTA